GTIEAVGARRGEREERRGLDEGAVLRGDAVGLLGDRRPIGFAVDALQRLDAGDDVIAKVRHVRLPRDQRLIARRQKNSFAPHAYAARSWQPSCPVMTPSRMIPGCRGVGGRAGVKCWVRPGWGVSVKTRCLRPPCAWR